MKILGVDFETSGLLDQNCRIIEIGAVLFDWDKKTPIEVFNVIVAPQENWDMMPGAELSHGMAKPYVMENGMPSAAALTILDKLVGKADVLCAHNGTQFDKPLLKSESVRHEMWSQADGKIWIDTMTDVPYPDQIVARKLVHLAAEHGFLNPFAHRAAFDVLTMFEILSKYDINAVIQNAIAPTVKIRALASYEQRELPKARRYRWEPTTKVWWKEIKEFDLGKEEKEAPFKIVVLETLNRTSGVDVSAFVKPAVGEPNAQEGGV